MKVARELARSRGDGAFGANVTPRSRDNFLYVYVHRARQAARAGYTSDADIGLHACDGAGASTVKGWRVKYPVFDRAIRHATMDINVEMTERMIDFARAGSESATKFWLERRNPAFQPTTTINHNGAGALADMLRKRMDDDEARDRGLIIDVSEDRLLASPEEFAEIEAEYAELPDE